MALYQIAHYQVNSKAIERVRQAIKIFVRHVRENEPGTRLYMAWQQKEDPTRFVHLFIFDDQAAHRKHGESDAVKKFEAVYSPELVGGPVVFTDYELVAASER